MMMYGMKVFAAVAMVGVGGVKVHSEEATQPLLFGNKGDVDMDSVTSDPSNIYFASFNCGGLEKMSRDQKKQIAESIVKDTDGEELIFVGLQELFELKGFQLNQYLGRNGLVNNVRATIQAELTEKYADKNYGYYHLTETSMWAQHMVVFARGDAVKARTVKDEMATESPTFDQVQAHIGDKLGHEGAQLVDPVTLSADATIGRDWWQQRSSAVVQSRNDLVTQWMSEVEPTANKFIVKGSFVVNDDLWNWKPSHFWVGNKGAVVRHITMYPDDDTKKKSVFAMNVHLPSDEGADADKKRIDMVASIKEYYSNYCWFKNGDNFFVDSTGKKNNVVFFGDLNARLDEDKFNIENHQDVTKKFKDLQELGYGVSVFKGMDKLRAEMTKMEFKEGSLEGVLPTYKIQGRIPEVQLIPTEAQSNPTNSPRRRSIIRVEGESLRLPSPPLSSVPTGVEVVPLDDQFKYTIGKFEYTRKVIKSSWVFWKKTKWYMPCWTDGIMVWSENAKIGDYHADHALADDTGSDHARLGQRITIV